ncbi:YihA family ribosome biogenesis GTP-binding protein [candidate division KSB1 bacterium]|nr:YihA family ribosome biogenesis GTP-binding protein [candidate division KSB1 bacterium]
MKITSAEFIKSIADTGQMPRDDFPQIAFAGRSNVGKSSLLNSLLNRKKLVQVSSTPGKTRLINFFLINNKFYFVDLPGYGYAKVSKQIYKNWQILLENYLMQSKKLQGVVVLIDLRHLITEADLQLIGWLENNKIPVLTVGTKSDKLSKNKIIHQKMQNEILLGGFNNPKIVPYSSVTGLGKSELWSDLMLLLDKKRLAI